MPQPYDYSTQPVNVDNYFNSLRQGREDRAQQETATRQTALQKYMPGALNGEAEAQQQAFGNATPDQAVQLKQALMQMEDRDLQKAKAMQDKFAGQAQWANTPERWAQVTQMAEAEGLKGAAQIPFELRGAKLAGMMTVKEQLDQEWKRREFELQTRETNASVAAKNAAADASRRSGREFEGRPKPLPQGPQRQENTWIEQTQVAANNVSDVTSYVNKIDAGQFDPGLLKNKYDQAKSFFGAVDPNDTSAINYNNFMADMNRLRNESLRLNVGPQTDRDAKRAWDELFDNINDKTIVRSRLAKIAEINKRAVRQKAALIQNQRKNYFGANADAPDWGSFGVDPTLFDQPAAKPAATGGKPGAAPAPSGAPEPPPGFVITR